MKFTQIFIGLSPTNKIIYGLVTIVFVLAGIIPAIIVYEENDKKVLQTKLDEKDKIHALERKLDADDKAAILTRYFNFVEVQLKEKYEMKKEVDSITTVNKK